MRVVRTWEGHGTALGVAKDFIASYQRIAELLPEVYQAKAAYDNAISKPGALDGKTKELIGMCCGIMNGSEICTTWHCRNAILLGATQQEVLEAAAVTFRWKGGTASVMACLWVLDAIETFMKDKEALDAGKEPPSGLPVLLAK